jgi:hypothetical protein
MEQRTIRLNFDLSFVYGPRTWRVPLVAVMLLAAVGDLNSESVTLSTYYPAPSGVYTNMITTGNTFLARDGGAVTKVGIGTVAPGAKLSVSGSMAVGAGYAAVVPPADALIVSGRLGVGIPAPTQSFDVGGNVNIAAGVGGNGYIHLNAAGCGAPTAVTSGAICGAGQYAAFSPGVYVEGWSYQSYGGPTYLMAPDGVTRKYKALALWGAPPAAVQSEMSIGRDESTMVVCCNK